MAVWFRSCKIRPIIPIILYTYLPIMYYINFCFVIADYYLLCIFINDYFVYSCYFIHLYYEQIQYKVIAINFQAHIQVTLPFFLFLLLYLCSISALVAILYYARGFVHQCTTFLVNVFHRDLACPWGIEIYCVVTSILC